MSYQSGSDATVRGNFIANGNLPNTQDSNFRPINQDFPVFGFAHSLGNVGATPVNVLYTQVHVQLTVVNFDGPSGNTVVPNLSTSYWSVDLDMISYFYNDWVNKVGAWDFKIAVDSLAAGGQDMLTITSLCEYLYLAIS